MKDDKDNIFERDLLPTEITGDTRQCSMIMGLNPSVVRGARQWFKFLEERKRRKEAEYKLKLKRSKKLRQLLFWLIGLVFIGIIALSFI
ncbi:MAG: hypothetical protein WCV41_03590 [Patescibacteria group bacterium]